MIELVKKLKLKNNSKLNNSKQRKKITLKK